MLNIPSEVKALFSGDAVHKNFHVHFPNGETTDLNNENILSESVQFTESLCSQQYFKFGLAEASQIEFTAVGIPNMRGAYIECAIEIDCTWLGDTWAAEHLPDLTLPFLTPQTCFYGDKLYYRVPYGRFRIDTCPRNHGAMWQRQITAYSDTIKANSIISPYEDFKLKMYASSSSAGAVKNGMKPFPEKYNPYLENLVNSILFWNNGDALANNGYSRTLVTDFLTTQSDFLNKTYLLSGIQNVSNAWKETHPDAKNYCRFNGYVKFIHCKILQGTIDGVSDTLEDWNKLYELKLTGFNRRWARQVLINKLEDLGIISLAQTSYGNISEFVNAKVDDTIAEDDAREAPQYKPIAYNAVSNPYPRRLDKRVEFSPYMTSQIVYGDTNEITYFQMADNGEVIYAGGRYGQQWIDIYVPVEIEYDLYYWQYGQSDILVERGTITYDDITEAKLYSLTRDEPTIFSDVKCGYTPTLKANKTVEQQSGTAKKYKVYGYENSYSLYDFAVGYIELCGSFLKPNREGNLELFQMSANPTAVEIPKSDWSSIWWDETDVQNIGKVEVIYSDDIGDKKQQNFSIGNGKSVYTMEDNGVLIDAELDDETLQSILDTYFAPNASVVNFTPADIKMRGLPYLESGDYIQLIAEDDTEVNTYVLSQTISGIQNLRTDITSTNGKLLEVIEDA